ncbi:YceI family protein [Gaetbulibacter saemankumensis]|uniref:YceI family protein n=1 Tax=Gaetbulibacter saemankumensis TaxID=311208 RepID=UPI0004205217|nr:YceI family protein [Gaetbulibacter saemankumensis]
MKRVLLLIIVFLSLAFTNKDHAKLTKTHVRVASGSFLQVKGNSNVNSFKCVYDTNKFQELIPVHYRVKNNEIEFHKTALVLETKFFDCGSRVINNDFQKLLKSKEYPKISLILQEISFLENEEILNAQVDIKIAGITNTYSMPVQVNKHKELHINGDLKLQLSDFQLVAPKKLFGLVVIDNEIEIDFKLVVRENR